MSTHTPAPWYTPTQEGDEQGLVYSERNGANIAAVYHPEDARLIAAAPELLDALKKVANCSTFPASDGEGLVFALDSLRDIARAAILKVEG